MTLERPSDEQLRAYLLGNVSADEQVAIAAFIDRHPEVISQLADAELQPDSLLTDLRQPTDAFAGEPQLWMGLEQACSIRLGPPTRDADPEVEQFQSLPRRLGRYILRERINRRGMGVVFWAVEDKTGDSVVIKVFPISRIDDSAATTRFRREMELVGKLNHPHIVRFLDAGETGQTLFLVMEHLIGFDLSRLVELQGPLPLGAACSMARQTALALQHAFEHQLVHRDVKPSNIFLTNEGTVKLLDLGLARPLHVDEDSLTHSGQLLGTVDYMAPEQAFDTHLADIRSDIYSLGCTLYKLLVGNAPFSGPEYRHLLKKALAHSSRPMVPIQDRRSDVPDELAKIIERMCAKTPEERFGTPKEVAEALAPFVDDSTLTSLVQQANTIAETQTPRRSEPTRRMGENRRTATLGTHSRLHWLTGIIVLTLLAVCGTVAGWWAWTQSNEKATAVTDDATPKANMLPVTTGDRPAHWQLVGSGDFESGMAGWPAQDPNDPRDKGLFEQSTEKSFDGRCSACSIPIADFASEGFACISDEHPLVVGQKYVLSAAFETSRMTVGNLSLDLSDSGFNVRINSLPNIKGWQFLWAEFVPNAPSIRVRLIRDGQLRRGERGFIDCVAITPASEFVPDRDRTLVSAKQPLSYRETQRIVQDSPYSGIWCINVSHDGRSVFTGSNDGGLRGWDLSTREQVLNVRRDHQADRPIHAFVFSEEENWCLA
ncbi:MAG: hypothetical protein FJ297_05065, partial [Planctomycetes bacterium]|nr:hypothetical protein [Planctomycetota bacterium]